MEESEGNNNNKPSRSISVAMDMIHSEEELRHAFSHLLSNDDDDDDGGGGDGYLEGHECLSLYRNVRKKYVDNNSNNNPIDGGAKVKDGPRQVRSFRSIHEGVLAAYQAGLCFQQERPASTLYVTLNPRHVPNAVKEVHSRYFQWLENNAGISRISVKKGDRADFAGTLYRALEGQLLACQSRAGGGKFSMIDIDDKDPTTWLARIREAIGDDAIEFIVDTKNGFHVIYQRKKMSRRAHKALGEVLESDKSNTGQESKVDNMHGGAISCALPGAYQAYHKTKIIACSCNNNNDNKHGGVLLCGTTKS